MKIGSIILLLSKEDIYVIEVSNDDFHSKYGIIRSKELKKAKFGDKIKTHLGKEFLLLYPNITDILERKAKRMPQIMLPKDVALILAYTGVSPNSLVVDAGCGSGYNAIFLANYIRPGKVVTYEKNEKFIKIAKENIRISGLSKFIKLKEKDILGGIEEKNVDLITLDMRGSEKVVENAFRVLKPGGWLVVYSPYIEQVISVRNEIENLDFTQIKTVENIVREWRVGRHTLPEVSGVMHTGWLTFARKIK